MLKTMNICYVETKNKVIIYNFDETQKNKFQFDIIKKNKSKYVNRSYILSQITGFRL